MRGALAGMPVATYAAMKSGLKALDYSLGGGIPLVATYAAMKSGLKVPLNVNPHLSKSSSNLCRDEKRTESILCGFDEVYRVL